MTHDAQCERVTEKGNFYCRCAERALAQAQSRVTQLEAVVNTRDLAIKRWCDELAQAQGESERLKAILAAKPGDLYKVIVKQMDTNTALRRALVSIAANTCCGPCQEAALVARAALTEPGGAQVERLTAALRAARQDFPGVDGRDEKGYCVRCNRLPHEGHSRVCLIGIIDAALTEPGGPTTPLPCIYREGCMRAPTCIEYCKGREPVTEPGGQP